MYMIHDILNKSSGTARMKDGGYSSVGSSTGLWFQVSWVRAPLPTLYYENSNVGLSPSGKAQDFDSCIRRFESS